LFVDGGWTDAIAEELQEKGANPVFDCAYECPLTFITEETNSIVNTIGLISTTGFLYYAGGLGDQPFWLIEAFEIFKAEEAIEMDKIRRQRKSGN
jgi:hypothetical protein